MKKIQEQGKVSFLQAIKDYFTGYFDFRGISTRAGYWWAILAILLIYILLFIITIALSQNGEYLNTFMFILILLFSLPLIIPSFALKIRRLRDVGLKSKAILTIYILYFASYGTCSMALYSSMTTSITNLMYTFGETATKNMNPLNTIQLSASPVIIFILMVLSVFLTIVDFLPTNMLTTKSKNPILLSIFYSI